MSIAYMVETDWAVHYFRGREEIVKKLVLTQIRNPQKSEAYMSEI